NTVIRYSLNVKRDGSYPINLACHSEAAGRDLRLTIHDLAGRLVKSFHLTNYPTNQLTTISWDGSDDSGKRLPSGIYFCKLFTESCGQVGDESLTKQLLLLR
ncbi:MAG: FlgD immunoglobulin-like domain containing protein, partial [bacterium]|nr:FlgD immunoglobulin-like domain containing protein [bacterium]